MAGPYPYNISAFDDDGNPYGGGWDTWTYDLDLTTNDPLDSSVGADFNLDRDDNGFGNIDGEASYAFNSLDVTSYGTWSTDTFTGEWTFTVDPDAFRDAVAQTVNPDTGKLFRTAEVEFEVIGTSTFEGEVGSDDDTVIITITICLARGTRVSTPKGQVLIEDLSAGDLVLTHDGRERPISWIGSRKLDAGTLACAPDLRPIRFAAGSLGPNKPQNDLLVSPQHRMLVSGWLAQLAFGQDEVLVPAKALVNDTTVKTAHDLDEVEYFHILFDAHEIILTEGTPTESLYPGPMGLAAVSESSRAEILRIFPNLADKKPIAARPAFSVQESKGLASWL